MQILDAKPGRSTWNGEKFRPLAGKVVVLMDEAEREYGGLALPDGVSLAPPIGTIVSSGEDTPEPGTRVLVAPDDGLELSEDGRKIVSLGHFTQHVGKPVLCDWWDSVLCEVTPAGNLVAYGDRVILQPDTDPERTQGGVYLPENSRAKTGRATVVSAGPLTEGLQAGDRVVYDPRATEYRTQDGLEITRLAGVCWVE